MSLRYGRYFALGLAGVLAATAATLQEVAADARLWPSEVTVTATARGQVMQNDQPAGLMLVGAGKTMLVSKVTAEGVIVKSDSALVRVPADKTDLLQRVDRPSSFAAASPTATGSTPAASSPGGSAVPSLMQRSLAGKLVRLENGKVRKADDALLVGVKYYALYYSASWCGPCKQFTPALVTSYNKLKAQYPEFEIVFISRDRSAGAMRDYMQDDKMTWPALSYDQIKDGSQLLTYMGPGIPCLVLVDAKGKVISDSFDGDNYLGPQKVLADATRLLKRGG